MNYMLRIAGVIHYAITKLQTTQWWWYRRSCIDMLFIVR